LPCAQFAKFAGNEYCKKRAILTGALTGANTGLSGIPQRFLDGLENIDNLCEMATKLAVQATNV
jgi:ADP-ribosylglycohydrolase